MAEHNSQLWGSQFWLQPPFRRLFKSQESVSSMRKPAKSRLRAELPAPQLQAGQSTVEFALAYAGVVFPLMFALIYTSQLLWIWHGVNDFTRRGAGYAASHCWQASGGNVLEYMKANLPPVIDQNQFESGPAVISVSYFAKDPDSGTLIPFSCDTECDVSCIPDTVTVSVTGFSYRTFVTSLGLPAVPLPDFQTSVPIESAGCDPEQGTCLP